MSKRFLSEETMFNFLSSTYIARLGDKSASWWDLDAGGELENALPSEYQEEFEDRLEEALKDEKIKGTLKILAKGKGIEEEELEELQREVIDCGKSYFADFLEQ